jgi:PhnB protein
MMHVHLNPYINFKGNARQAMEFYQSVFGGKLALSTFKDYNSAEDPSEENLIMHAELNGENEITFMGSDTPGRMEYRPGTNFNMSLMGDNEAVLTGYFNKLAASGVVTMPLTKAVWGDSFGMLTDQFGVGWMVNISGKKD